MAREARDEGPGLMGSPSQIDFSRLLPGFDSVRVVERYDGTSRYKLALKRFHTTIYVDVDMDAAYDLLNKVREVEESGRERRDKRRA